MNSGWFRLGGTASGSLLKGSSLANGVSQRLKPGLILRACGIAEAMP